ncbi:sideroflexin-3-like isoform X3 [Lampetra planeri]
MTRFPRYPWKPHGSTGNGLEGLTEILSGRVTAKMGDGRGGLCSPPSRGPAITPLGPVDVLGARPPFLCRHGPPKSPAEFPRTRAGALHRDRLPAIHMQSSAKRISTPAVVFWQWINQSFNAIVNFTNRSGVAPMSTMQLASAYICATSGAVATALALKSLAKTLPPIMGRLVPFAAVAAANCINVPFMRQRELIHGVSVADEHGVRVSESRIAARSAIAQVVFSRVCMALPAMAIPPVIMNTLEKRPLLKRIPWIGAPVQVALVGLCLVFATPLCCALFPQNSSMPVSRLEPEVRVEIWSKNPKLCVVFFNKGL